MAVEIAGSDEASAPPPGLRLPLAVNVEKIAISRLDYGKLFGIDDLQAAFASDGMNHRLSGVRGKFGKTAIAGELTLGGDAPLPVQASATLAGQIDEQPVRLVAEAAGPLERIVLKVSAAEGLRGDGQATLTPFARHAFAEAQLALADVDPAAWIAGAPHARLTLRAQIKPDDRQEVALTGDFSVGNSIAGPLDRQRLPLESLSGRFDWADDGVRISGLKAGLPGQGRLNGGGNWRDGSLALDLDASALDAAQVASVLRLTRLNGPISARIGAARQQLSIRLADARFVLAAEASHENGRVSLSRLELGAGEARLTLRGELDTARNMAFSVTGELTRFDPRRFARVPAALLNGTLSASGSLQPAPRRRGAIRPARQPACRPAADRTWRSRHRLAAHSARRRDTGGRTEPPDGARCFRPGRRYAAGRHRRRRSWRPTGWTAASPATSGWAARRRNRRWPSIWRRRASGCPASGASRRPVWSPISAASRTVRSSSRRGWRPSTVSTSRA